MQNPTRKIRSVLHPYVGTPDSASGIPVGKECMRYLNQVLEASADFRKLQKAVY